MIARSKTKSPSSITERTVEFSTRLIYVYRKLESSSVGRIVGKQLLRAGTSIGANVHEAQAAQSKADFIAKISISHKEARETLYWLRLIKKSNLLKFSEIEEVFDEAEQVTKILSSILLTSKGEKRVSNNSSFLTMNS